MPNSIPDRFVASWAEVAIIADRDRPLRRLRPHRHMNVQIDFGLLLGALSVCEYIQDFDADFSTFCLR